MMMKRGGGALTEQSTRPLCPWLPLGTGFGVPPRWGRRPRVSDTYPGAPCIYVPQTAPPYTRHNESRALGKKRDLR
jgi:hypothetical protein